MIPWGIGTLVLLTIWLLPTGGCATIRITEPPRTATEQFLLSQAIDRAIESLGVISLRDRPVYVDSTYLYSGTPAVERLYMLGELRAKLLAHGIRLAPDRETAQVILEVRTPGIGIDRTDFLIGIPSIYLPGAVVGDGLPVATPELAVVKNIRQMGYASVSLVAYWADTGEWIVSSGPFVGETYRSDWWFFGYGPRTVGNIVTTEQSQ